jgi:hypothetical protein
MASILENCFRNNAEREAASSKGGGGQAAGRHSAAADALVDGTCVSLSLSLFLSLSFCGRLIMNVRTCACPQMWTEDVVLTHRQRQIVVSVKST